MTFHRLRTVATSALAVGVATVVLWAVCPEVATAAPAAPSTPAAVGDGSGVPGFITPVVSPPEVIIGTGLALGGGGTAATITAASGGVAATCGALSGGMCLVAGGVIIGAGVASYTVTTAALNWLFPPVEFHPVSLSSPMIRVDVEPCSTANGGYASQAAAYMSGARCIFLARGAIDDPTSGTSRTNALSWPGNSTGGDNSVSTSDISLGVGWNVGSLSWGLFYNATTRATDSTATGNRSWTGDPKIGTTYPAAFLTTYLPPVSAGSPCYGVVTCGIMPQGLVRWSMGNTAVQAPIDSRVAANGLQRRTVTTADCKNLDTGVIQTKSLYSAWWYDKEHTDGKFPMQFPGCGATVRVVPSRLTAKVQTLGFSALRSLLDVSLPDYDLEVVSKMKKCTQAGRECQAHRQGPACVIDGGSVDLRWCDDTQALATAYPDLKVWTDAAPATGRKPRPDTEVTDPPNASPVAPVTPETPDVDTATDTPPEGLCGAATDDTNDEDKQGDCLPSGWGLLNPVDWVVKPMKCVFRWAFVPKVAFQLRLDRLRQGIDGSGVGTIGSMFGGLTSGVGAGLSNATGDNCEGPDWKPLPDGATYHPFSSCGPPMRQLSLFVRGLISSVVMVIGAVTIYNSLVWPFGIEPLQTPHMGRKNLG